jgi:hypothetical protein
MGLLTRALRPSGPTLGRPPPVPFGQVQEMWYPWYQTLSNISFREQRPNFDLVGILHKVVVCETREAMRTTCCLVLPL